MTFQYLRAAGIIWGESSAAENDIADMNVTCGDFIFELLICLFLRRWFSAAMGLGGYKNSVWKPHAAPVLQAVYL